MPIGTVTWHCACNVCACVAEVSGPGTWCGNCAGGNHHNMASP